MSNDYRRFEDVFPNTIAQAWREPAKGPSGELRYVLSFMPLPSRGTYNEHSDEARGSLNYLREIFPGMILETRDTPNGCSRTVSLPKTITKEMFEEILRQEGYEITEPDTQLFRSGVSSHCNLS